MKATWQITWRLASALSAILLLSASAQADTPAFASGGFSTEQPPSFTGTRGWSFYNYNPDGTILITQLGIFDSGGDGLMNSHQIGLWGLNGALLASATIPAGTVGSLIDGYRYVAITPVMIPSGDAFDPTTAFIVAAQYSAGDADDLVTPTPIFNGFALAKNTEETAGWNAME